MKKDLKELLASPTLEEKATLCSGATFWRTKAIERLGIPAIMMTDGPHGLRKQVDENEAMGLKGSGPATCFPTTSALASSWDIETSRNGLLRVVSLKFNLESLPEI